jgi:sec-independent protein translocase protein TatA
VAIVILLGILIFGAKRLPDSARALGRSMRILKAEAKGLKDDDKGDVKDEPAPAPKQLPESSADQT